MMKKRIGAALLVLLLCVIPVTQTKAATMKLAVFQKEEQEEQPRPIFIRRLNVELEAVTYKDGEMVTSNPRNEVITYYIVGQEDENISSIAECLHITEEALRAENPSYEERSNDEFFQRSTHVRLPSIEWEELDDVYYQIEPGDCMENIAYWFGTKCWDIQKMNEQIEDPNLIYSEDWIKVR